MEPMFDALSGEMMNPLMNRILDYGFADDDFMEATFSEAEIDGR